MSLCDSSRNNSLRRAAALVSADPSQRLVREAQLDGRVSRAASHASAQEFPLTANGALFSAPELSFATGRIGRHATYDEGRPLAASSVEIGCRQAMV